VTPGDGVELKSADLNRSSITTELLSLFHGTIVSGRGIEFIDQNIDDKDIEGSLRVIKNLLESEDPTTDEGICIVLRGLPGSGKSTLASMFLNKAENGMIVSADHYFEQGAGVLSGKAKKGLSTEEIYDRCFDQSRQAKAHQHCREEFTRALVSKASPVLVDNTNVERREYAHYERTATISGYKVIVIEVARAEICCTKQDVIRRGAEIDNAKTRRDELGNGGDSGGGGFGIHHVPYSVVFRMQSRWENDSRAVRLQFWKGRIQSKRASTDSP
jgi:predicted kinase